MSKDEILKRSIDDLAKALDMLQADQNLRPAKGTDVLKVAKREKDLLEGISKFRRARVLLNNGRYKKSLAEMRPISKDIRGQLIELKDAIATAQAIGGILSLIDRLLAVAAGLW